MTIPCNRENILDFIHHVRSKLPKRTPEEIDRQIREERDSWDDCPPSPLDPPQYSSIDIIMSAPGQQIFRTPEEVDRYIQEERDSWDD